MSDFTSNYDVESKLSLVVRMPQEGKTFICISSIVNDTSSNIHIVLTMNTLSAGMQFFGRMEEEVGPKRIVVWNSKKSTAGKCHHAKSFADVILLIQKESSNNGGIKVVVCCAHTSKIREQIPALFDFACGNAMFAHRNIKFRAHIDEAHKYIPENMEQIRRFNESAIVSEITGYSATPNGIWTSSASDPMFHKILIRDVETELSIVRSPHYFGVDRCELHICNTLTHQELIERFSLEEKIPDFIFDRAKMTSSNRTTWYNKYPFDIGNEQLLLSFVNYILPSIDIDPTRFSYNFLPAYTRKATHYQMVEIIMNHIPTSNVITMNGDGISLFRYDAHSKRSRMIKTSEMLRQQSYNNEIELNLLHEPSYVIQQLIRDSPDCPTFVTGFTCVGMSVTLINTELGNFDTVIMAHQHYSMDKQYQLCRFLFNYTKWSEEQRSKIKRTRFYSLTEGVIENCLRYEALIKTMSTDFAGKTCSLREIQGLEPDKPTERELNKQAMTELGKHILNPDQKIWRKFKVYEGNDEAEWSKVEEFYKEFMGKPIIGKSKPKLDSTGFWNCSTLKNVKVHTASEITELYSQSWQSTLALRKIGFKYARLFVGYDNLSDSSEYTIYMKFVELEDCPQTREILLYNYNRKNKNNKSGEETKKNESDDDDVSV